MTSLKKRILALDHNTWTIGGFVALGLILMIYQSSPSLEPETAPTSFAADRKVADASIDTFVPVGFVLIPLEIQNSSALSGLIGELGGVIDLYTAAGEGQKSLKVASKIKLVRAPLNADQFAVLVREQNSHLILRHPGPFVALIQNPQAKTTDVVTEESRPQVQIEYAAEDAS